MRASNGCRRVGRLCIWVVCLMCVGMGCENKPLFPPDVPRTPYERYQKLRGQNRSMTQENAYGGQQPALRGRLKPLDDQ